MESHLLTLLGSAVLSVCLAFMTMRWVIKDLRSENTLLKAQVTAAQASSTANQAKLLILEAKVDACEKERKEANDRMLTMSNMCPVTEHPCPLRQYFGKVGRP